MVSNTYMTVPVATAPIPNTVSIRRRSPPMISAHRAPTMTDSTTMPPTVITGLFSQVFRSMATYCLSSVEIQNTGSEKHRNATNVTP